MGVTTSSNILQTYNVIQSVTLTTNTTTVVLGSGGTIPQIYTDLVLIINAAEVTGNNNGVRFQVGNNSVDTGSNYSMTYLGSNGSSTYSQRQSNISYFDTAWAIAPGGSIGNYIQTSFFPNYSNPYINKTLLTKVNNPSGATEINVGLWRSNSSINIINIYTSGGSGNPLLANSSFTLYGIKAG